MAWSAVAGGGPASLAQSPGVSHGLDLEGLRSL